MHGEMVYTVAQVAVNDLLLLVFYVPTVKLLAGAQAIEMPWATVVVSVVVFALVPVILGVAIRAACQKFGGLQVLDERAIPVLDSMGIYFLLAMILLLFVTQAQSIATDYVNIVLISVPLVL